MRLKTLLEELKFFDDLTLKEPDWFQVFLIRILNGDSLTDMALEHMCFPGSLREWIRRDDERETAYQDTLEKQREMRSQALMDRTAAAAFATVQDARNGSGTEWLEIDQWPKGLLAAADKVEFSEQGKPFKISMEAGKHADRLSRMLGMDKTGQTSVNITSLVSVLSEMPPGAIRQRPGPKLVEADAGEGADAARPAGTLLLDNPPRQAV